jgi:hypothetical protein
MTTTDISADLARFAAAGLTRTLAAGPDLGPGYRRAAANTLRDLEERARVATRRETAAHGWGHTFVTSDAWTNRTGYVTRTPCIVGGPLEERADIGGADIGTAELAPAPPMFTVIASRCDLRPAAPGNATVIRWSGPLRPRPVPEGDLKPGAGLTPAIAPVILPMIAYWVGVSRQVLSDHDQLAAIIDGRLRRGLGQAIDDQIAAALADDDDIAEVTAAGDLGAAIRAAVGQLAVHGYYGNTVVIISPEDLPGAEDLTGLHVLGVDMVIPSAGVGAGTAIAADLRAAVQVRYHGTARLLTTDSNAGQFLANEITLLAEQRALGAVVDPAAAVKATTGAARAAAPAAPKSRRHA